MARPTLIWHDTDKKGRPRQRDCRPMLRSLALTEPGEGGGLRFPSLRLVAAIDPQGRSLRPEQLEHWLTEALRQPPGLRRLCRTALQLQAC
jgi:hypothetical protein